MARHDHRCHGVDVLRDPVPGCPCDCGDARDPDQVWIAAMLDRQRAAGLHACTWREDDSGLRAARPE